MLTIGDFARLGGVSVRMLRHYDATGLLVPARVDAASGYRYYAVGQLTRLDRLLALKDLGFTLDRVRTILDDEVSPEELRGMLRLRRAELAEQIDADRQRLARVEARLRSIESESAMNTLSDKDFEIISVTGHRLLSLAATTDGQPPFGEIVSSLFGRVADTVAAAGGAPSGPTVATYDFADDGTIRITAGFPWEAPAPDGDAEVVDLPPIEQCARSVYRGSMAGIGDAWQQLVRRIDADGWVLDGVCREVYLHTPFDDPDAWVTELQQPVRRA
ncbi:MAG: MerR family transcriptional regulator [Actinobacteria bacterium]|nr:MerR family transcriptional regulator [Actinomycetota bacterium]